MRGANEACGSEYLKDPFNQSYRNADGCIYQRLNSVGFMNMIVIDHCGTPNGCNFGNTVTLRIVVGARKNMMETAPTLS
ncbi:hypothetical protein V6N13_135308 [Hibiscus sabdariffa]